MLDYGADPLQEEYRGVTPYNMALKLARKEAVWAMEMRMESRHPQREEILREAFKERMEGEKNKKKKE